MDEKELAAQFESFRPHLRSVAYRMLGSVSEADDAVQEAWFRLHRADAAEVENLKAWLTTVVARLSLDVLRTRQGRSDAPTGTRLPDPIVGTEDSPEADLLHLDSIGMALLVVLETLPAAERLAFVLHDLFAVPFEDIAPIVQRTPTAARQLASRARKRVQDTAKPQDPDLSQQRAAVDAFLAASRNGDFGALMAVLDPQVVLYSERPAQIGASIRQVTVRGAETVAKQSLFFSRQLGGERVVRVVRVNRGPGIVTYLGSEVYSVMAFTLTGGKIAEIHVLADPARLKRLALPPLGD